MSDEKFTITDHKLVKLVDSNNTDRIMHTVENTKPELKKPTSFNGKLVLEAYNQTELRAEVKSGWATLNQRNSLKGLTVLIQANLPDGSIVPVGSTAYIKEESLHTQPFAKARLKSDTLKQEFILVGIDQVEYIVPPTGDVA